MEQIRNIRNEAGPTSSDERPLLAIIMDELAIIVDRLSMTNESLASKIDTVIHGVDFTKPAPAGAEVPLKPVDTILGRINRVHNEITTYEVLRGQLNKIF